MAALAGGASVSVETTGDALARAARWLCARVQEGDLEPAPIGLYFSSLRYSERLYPPIFALTGLGRVGDSGASSAQVSTRRVDGCAA